MAMNAQVQSWMPTSLVLFGSLLVVVFSAWLNTRALSAQIDGVDKKLRAQIDAASAPMDAMDQKMTAQIDACAPKPTKASRNFGSNSTAAFPNSISAWITWKSSAASCVR